jgi:hypothetical protein
LLFIGPPVNLGRAAAPTRNKVGKKLRAGTVDVCAGERDEA